MEKPQKSEFSWRECRQRCEAKFGKLSRLELVYLFIHFHTAVRYERLRQNGHARLFWTSVAAIALILLVFGILHWSRSPRSVLQERLLTLASQYYNDHSAAVDDKYAGTVSLTVDLLRESGYDVRKFDRYECDGRSTNVLIRSANDEEGYKVLNYNISCRRLGR